MLFHQLQLMVCAALARSYADTAPAAATQGIARRSDTPVASAAAIARL
ncbi:MAG TPA: hypothetical protein VKI44_31745 [Acetobacteraceae bacterium]|nr:hypothetical protein [Acetobacteraceae bacterium]